MSKVDGSGGVVNIPPVTIRSEQGEAIHTLRVAAERQGNTTQHVTVKFQGRDIQFDFNNRSNPQDVYNQLKNQGLNDQQIQKVGSALAFPWMANMDEALGNGDGVTAESRGRQTTIRVGSPTVRLSDGHVIPTEL